MAAFHGYAGSVTFTGITTVLCTSWSADVKADVAEATAMGDTWKTYHGGFKDWTASVECLLDTAGVYIAAFGTSATLVLTAVSGTGFTGTAICNGIAINTDANDIAKVTYTFQGNGALTEV